MMIMLGMAANARNVDAGDVCATWMVGQVKIFEIKASPFLGVSDAIIAAIRRNRNS